MTKTLAGIGLLGVSALAVVYIYRAKPFSTEADVSQFIWYIHSFGLLAPGVAFFLATVHGVFPYVPFFILAGAIAAVFGVWWGFLLSWGGALLGSVLSFVMARYLGQDWFLRKAGPRYGAKLEALDGPKAFWAILMGRIVPVLPAPVINVGAGVSTVSFPIFLAATGLGKLPFTLAYTFLGVALVRSRHVVDAVIGLAVFGFAGYLFQYFRKRKKSAN